MRITSACGCTAADSHAARAGDARGTLSGAAPASIAGSIFVTSFGAVANDGQDDSTAINNAIASANPGDTVVFSAGTFNTANSITPKSGVKLVGTRIDPTTIQYIGTTLKPMVNIASQSNEEFSGFTLDGNSNANAQHGFNVSSSSGLNIHDVKVKNLTGTPAFGPIGVYFASNVTDSKVTNSSFSNIGVSTPLAAASASRTARPAIRSSATRSTTPAAAASSGRTPPTCLSRPTPSPAPVASVWASRSGLERTSSKTTTSTTGSVSIHPPQRHPTQHRQRQVRHLEAGGARVGGQPRRRLRRQHRRWPGADRHLGIERRRQGTRPVPPQPDQRLCDLGRTTPGRCRRDQSLLLSQQHVFRVRRQQQRQPVRHHRSPGTWRPLQRKRRRRQYPERGPRRQHDQRQRRQQHPVERRILTRSASSTTTSPTTPAIRSTPMRSPTCSGPAKHVTGNGANVQRRQRHVQRQPCHRRLHRGTADRQRRHHRQPIP